MNNRSVFATLAIWLAFTVSQSSAANFLETTYTTPQNEANAAFYFNFGLASPQVSAGGMGTTVIGASSRTYNFMNSTAARLSVFSNPGVYGPATDQGGVTLIGVGSLGDFCIELTSSANTTDLLSEFVLTAPDGSMFSIPSLLVSNGNSTYLQIYGFTPGNVQVTGNQTITSTTGVLPASGDGLRFIGFSQPFDVPEPSPLAYIGGGLLALFGFSLLRKRQTMS